MWANFPWTLEEASKDTNKIASDVWSCEAVINRFCKIIRAADDASVGGELLIAQANISTTIELYFVP